MWAFHDRTDLGNEDLRRIARQAACSLEDLRRIL